MINKKIFYLIFEIISLLLIIFITNNLWNKMTAREVNVAYAYTNESKLILNVDNNLSSLVPIDDDKISNEEVINIEIININNIKKKYNLYFVIKDTNLNEDYLKIRLNNEINYLKDLKFKEEDGFSYYKITSGNIDKQSKEIVVLNLYLSSETPNSEQGKNMNIRFKIEEI